MSTTVETLPSGCTRTTTYQQVPQYDSAGNITGYVNTPVSICYDCPALPEIQAVPERTLVDPRLGWNSGATSVDVFAGDCVTEFAIPEHAAGVVCGLASTFKSTNPKDVDHGFFVFQEAGRELWCIVERGVKVSAPVVRVPDTDLFRIERRGTTVRYFFNSRQVQVSALPAPGERRVVACLYSANDGVL